MFLMKIHENKMQNYRQRNCNYLNNDLCIKYTQYELLQFMVIASWTISLYKDCKCGLVLNWQIIWKCVI